MPSWRLHLETSRKSPDAIRGYVDDGKRFAGYLDAQEGGRSVVLPLGTNAIRDMDRYLLVVFPIPASTSDNTA